MGRRMRMTIATLTGLALAASLTACAPWVFFRGGDRDGSPRGGVAPRDEPTAGPETPLPLDEGSLACLPGADLTIEQSARSVEVTGRCGRVVVRGQAVSVELESAASMLIEGQAVRVQVDGDLGGLEIKGQANEVEAASLGALAISGDDNSVETGEIGAVSIQGNGNTVEASADPAPLSVNGDGNSIRRSG